MCLWVLSGLLPTSRRFRSGLTRRCLGGAIRPSFEGTPPAWLTAVWRDVSNAFAVRDLGAEAVSLDSRSAIPYGANFAIRLTEQRKCAYDPDLGRKLKSGYLADSGYGAAFEMPIRLNVC